MQAVIIEGVRVRLQRRWRAVLGAHQPALGARLRVLAQFIRANPVCAAHVARLDAEHAALDTWGDDPVQWKSIHELASELEVAASAWFLVRHLSELETPNDVLEHILNVGHRDHPRRQMDHDDRTAYVLETYVQPLFDYLDEQLDERAEVLAELRRFQQWAEWFGQGVIHGIVEEENARRREGNNRRIEARLKTLMFERMFTDGLALERVFREVELPSGRVDFIVELHGRPVAAEAKIFGDGYGKTELSGGRGQLQEYMRQVQCDTGYLVIFNRDPRRLVLELRGKQDGVPYVSVGQRTVYVFVGEAAGDSVSASKRGGIDQVVLTADDLLRDIGVED